MPNNFTPFIQWVKIFWNMEELAKFVPENGGISQISSRKKVKIKKIN
jgi:hypothetical protein